MKTRTLVVTLALVTVGSLAVGVSLLSQAVRRIQASIRSVRNWELTIQALSFDVELKVANPTNIGFRPNFLFIDILLGSVRIGQISQAGNLPKIPAEGIATIPVRVEIPLLELGPALLATLQKGKSESLVFDGFFKTNGLKPTFPV